MEANTNSDYCKSNCGFFGNQASEGYCSKCYKEYVKRQNSGSVTNISSEKIRQSVAKSSSVCNSVPGTKKKNRCAFDICKRKIGLTGYDCRCGKIFCWEHRYTDKHNCEFDYKELGQEQIRKANPIIVGEKIYKI